MDPKEFEIELREFKKVLYTYADSKQMSDDKLAIFVIMTFGEIVVINNKPESYLNSTFATIREYVKEARKKQKGKIVDIKQA